MMVGMAPPTTEADAPASGDRRLRRHQETIEEILAIAEAVMNEEGKSMKAGTQPSAE